MRGTWIEILIYCIMELPAASRPPCGGRGLKSFKVLLCGYKVPVVPRAGDVDSGSKTNAAVCIL